MARNTPKSKRTRQRILEVALPIFANRGYAAASLRTIASAADVNVAAVAYHFGDKEGLYRTVIERLYEDLSVGLASVNLAQLGGLNQAVHWGWDFALAHRDHIRLTTRHFLDHERRPEVVTERWAEPMLQIGEQLIQEFRPDWSLPQCRLFVFSVQHLITRFAIEEPEELSRLLGGVEDLDETIRHYFETFLARELGLNT